MARNFDGSGDYIDCGTHASIHDLGLFTFSCWFKSVDGGEGDMGRFFQSAPDLSGHRILYINNAGNIKFQVDYDTTDLIRESDAVFSHGTWTHLVITWDGSSTAANVHIYKDGLEVSGYNTTTDGAGSLVSDSGQSFYIGNRPGNTTRSFNGDLAEVAIWNSALTTVQILSLAKGFSPLFVQPQNLIAYWNLIRGLNDRMGASNGAATGTTVVAHTRMIYPARPQM